MTDNCFQCDAPLTGPEDDLDDGCCHDCLVACYEKLIATGVLNPGMTDEEQLEACEHYYAKIRGRLN